MRKNQVTLDIVRFGDEAPEGAERQEIKIYADANNLWEALAAAMIKVSEVVGKDQEIPSFGAAFVQSNTYPEKKEANEATEQKETGAEEDVRETAEKKDTEAWADLIIRCSLQSRLLGRLLIEMLLETEPETKEEDIRESREILGLMEKMLEEYVPKKKKEIKRIPIIREKVKEGMLRLEKEAKNESISTCREN